MSKFSTPHGRLSPPHIYAGLVLKAEESSSVQFFCLRHSTWAILSHSEPFWTIQPALPRPILSLRISSTFPFANTALIPKSIIRKFIAVSRSDALSSCGCVPDTFGDFWISAIAKWAPCWPAVECANTQALLGQCLHHGWAGDFIRLPRSIARDHIAGQQYISSNMIPAICF